jgi:hypothetical protein
MQQYLEVPERWSASDGLRTEICKIGGRGGHKVCNSAPGRFLAKRHTDKSKVQLALCKRSDSEGRRSCEWPRCEPRYIDAATTGNNVAPFSVRRPLTCTCSHLTVQYCTNMPSLTRQKRCVSRTTRASSAGPNRWLSGEDCYFDGVIYKQNTELQKRTCASV